MLSSVTTSTTTRNTLSFDHANWTDYRIYISKHVDNVPSPVTDQNLYHCLDTIPSTVQTAFKSFIPTTITSSVHSKLPAQYLPLIDLSHQLYKDYKRTENLELLHLHRQLQRTVHNLKSYKLRQWVKTRSNVSAPQHPTKHWIKFNALTGKYSHTSYPIIDQEIHNDKEKADSFAKYLQEIFTPLQPDRPASSSSSSNKTILPQLICNPV